MTRAAPALDRARHAPEPLERGPVTSREGERFLESCPFAECDERLVEGDWDASAHHIASHHCDADAANAHVRTWLYAARQTALGRTLDAASESPLADALIEALSARGGAAQLEQLGDDVGERSPRVRVCLRRLAARGVVVEVGAIWRLVVETSASGTGFR